MAPSIVEIMPHTKSSVEGILETRGYDAKCAGEWNSSVSSDGPKTASSSDVSPDEAAEDEHEYEK